jgi:hypothetical protein
MQRVLARYRRPTARLQEGDVQDSSGTNGLSDFLHLHRAAGVAKKLDDLVKLAMRVQP